MLVHLAQISKKESIEKTLNKLKRKPKFWLAEVKKLFLNNITYRTYQSILLINNKNVKFVCYIEKVC